MIRAIDRLCAYGKDISRPEHDVYASDSTDWVQLIMLDHRQQQASARRRWVALPLLLTLLTTPTLAGLQLRVNNGHLTTATQPSPAAGKPAAPQPDTPIVLVPSPGRPTFCTPSGQLTCLLHLAAQIGQTPRFWLQNSLYPNLRYPLLQVTDPIHLGDDYARVQLSTPEGTPPGLYNLLVAGSTRETLCPRSVCIVREYKTTFRFVHLSNMNIGDPTAVQFDSHLPEEINLLAPEFIIATGDYTEWARIADNPADWQRVLDYMAHFHAPVYMLCGDHDHEASFTRYAANSLIGTIDYGRYHGLLLLDHGYHPIEQDDQQIQWILTDLAANRDKTFNFIVTHSDELGLVRHLKEMKLAEQVFHDNKVKMLICGSHTDWDYKEFSSVLSGLSGLNFIRTAQSSTAVCDKADGISRYRVIEVTGDRVSCVCPDESLRPRVQTSVPSGHLLTTLDGPNDGSQEVITANIANTLPRSWNNCQIWLQVRKDKSSNPPAVAGGTLLRYLDLGQSWAVLAGFDLPDKGSVTIQTGPANQLVPAPSVRMEIIAPSQLSFTSRYASFGLTYFTCSTPVTLRLTNRTNQPATAWPIVRLNGTNLQVAAPEPLPVTVAPQSTQLLKVGLSLGQVALGPHMLQAYLLDDPLRRLTTEMAVLLIEPEASPRPTPQSATTSQPVSSQPTTTAPATKSALSTNP